MTFDLLLWKQTLPHQVIRKAEDGKEVATVEADKLEEAVAGGRCLKMVWLRALQKTGEFDIFFSSWIGRLNCITEFSSETWFLPIVTLLLIVIYSAVAIKFYMNG